MEAREGSPSGSSRRSSSRSGSRRSSSRSGSQRSSSRRSSSRSGSRRSGSSESSSGSSPELDVTVPQIGDGPEMLLWRATVDPVRNIGSPINAVWYYPGDVPNTADENRTSIKPAVERLMILTYPDGGVGYWTPGEAVENVTFFFFPHQSSQTWHPDIRGPEFDEYVVYHRTSMPLGKTYNSQYVPPQYYPMDRASELVVEVLQYITRDLYGKGKKYIRNYVNRYFVTPSISDEFTAEADKEARNMIVDIFLRANQETHDEVEVFVEDEWDNQIRDNDLFNFIFFDENFLRDNLGVKMYNKKGKPLRPANKAEARREPFLNIQYIPRFKPSLSPKSKKVRRRRTERRRDKKILKEYQALMESTKDNPSAIYDGGRRRRRTMRKK